ncbi:hypothetical protein BSL78_17135 [Apostichopus japonicus]|uniref:Reverse transcriptase domain-containing protein n=1 Tax=Stichopus japonicus TaxID=307972 RepID=A0A2G8KDC7_STIJA|nr:hypothetical protein BSL78_17135 [Apostichopus japonicus]
MSICLRHTTKERIHFTSTPLPSPEVKSISTPTGVALATAPCIRDQSGVDHISSPTDPSEHLPDISVKLKNSDVLCNLSEKLSHLSKQHQIEMSDLINSHVDLFTDIPRRTHLVCHNVDVGDAVPIKQHPYRLSPIKMKHLQNEYTVMPFGMKNAPATFQRFINTLVGDLQGCSVYIDDIVIYSQTWQEHIAQIRSLMERLCSANLTVNLVKNFEKQFKLAVDASDFGAGSILLQQDSEGIDHPVCYFSKKFNKHQQNYSTVEKETLALLLSLQMFDVYLGTTPFPVIVLTDHNPLTFVHNMKNHNKRLLRWSLIFQEYNLDIQHIRGKDNIFADALSRI